MTMNITPYFHLCWKEYRSIRSFWVAIVGLVVLLQWIAPLISSGPLRLGGLEFNLALAFPALFAVGCAGIAFSGEREEGTYNFLCAIPALPRHIVVSKIIVPVLATLIMYGVLWFFSLLRTHGELPPGPVLSDMLGLWVVAALEGIAWGTFFSLLLSRPLLAVILAIAAASTESHLLMMHVNRFSGYEFHNYSIVAPWRVLIAAVVLCIDVVLGLRWLHGRPRAKAVRRSAVGMPAAVQPQIQLQATEQREESSAAPAIAVGKLLAERDRGAMFGRLLWQHWRQSRILMATLAGLSIIVTLVSLTLAGQIFWRDFEKIRSLRPGSGVTYVPMALFAALMGCFVFRADQERSSFRFFVEHNVPPRYVWLSRQLPWLSTLLVCVSIINPIWLMYASIFGTWWWRSELTNKLPPGAFYSIILPPLDMGLACVVVAYAAGQLASILIRSAILSAFFGLLLTGILCAWVAMMHAMQVPFWWSVLPIPLVLLWATWLQAPNWIGENRRPRARTRLAASVLIPSAVLCLAVPIFRVHQVPLASPGFIPSQYLANLSEGLSTGQIYKEAAEQYDYLVGRRLPRKEALEVGEKSIDLILQASQRPVCHIDDPEVMTGNSRVFAAEAVAVLLENGQRFADQGKLDDAFNRYFAAMHVTAHCAGVWLNANNWDVTARDVFQSIASWGVAKNQTVEHLRSAIKQLESVDASMLHLDDAIKDQYIIASRVIRGDQTASLAFYMPRYSNSALAITTLMPWDSDREMRLLNLITGNNLALLHELVYQLQQQLNRPIPFNSDSNGIAGLLPPRWIDSAYATSTTIQAGSSRHYEPYEEAIWIATTWPNLSGVYEIGFYATRRIADFEALRRATIVILALEAYRVDHDRLPESLDQLAGKYLDKVPPDPYSGLEFSYFPTGLPKPEMPLQAALLSDAQWNNSKLQLNQPGIWCMGPDLRVNFFRPRTTLNTIDAAEAPTPYYTTVEAGQNAPMLGTYEVLVRGLWFPIP